VSDYTFISHNNYFYYTTSDGSTKVTTGIETDSRILYLDSYLDIKVITVPNISSKEVLTDVVYNTVKKYIAHIPEKNDVDYIILSKDSQGLNILVFIRNPEVLESREMAEDSNIKRKNKRYSVYHILNELVKTDEEYKNESFVVREEENYYIYIFKDGIFRKRVIYFENDIETLKNEKVFFIRLLENEEDLKLENAIVIEKEKIRKIMESIKDRDEIFKAEDPKRLFKISLIAIFSLLMITACVEFFLFNQNEKNKNLENEIAVKEKELKKLKSNTVLSESLQKSYLGLISKKSNHSAFFKVLYKYGAGNIELEAVSFEGKKFVISGTCGNDSAIENSIRKSVYFRNVTFYFTRKNDKKYFRIEGEFINDF
jgi:hypothetical protein